VGGCLIDYWGPTGRTRALYTNVTDNLDVLVAGDGQGEAADVATFLGNVERLLARALEAYWLSERVGSGAFMK
jgi:hypothetical protein